MRLRRTTTTDATDTTDTDAGSTLDPQTAADEPMIRVAGLNKQYATYDNTITASHEVTFTIERGTTTALTGPSGSGKSTLLHLIGALDRPDSGSIHVDGADLSTMKRSELAAYRRRVGFVFQRFNLLPTLTVLDNVLAPTLPFKVEYDARSRALSLLEQVGLGGREHTLAARLSGGQQQRVAIARALINDPVLLLADEPTGNLDTKTGEEIATLLLSLRDQRGTTLLVATHDPALTTRFDRALLLIDGQLQEDYTPTP
jgi:putative ABC transport system ATP-binding protein